jgi:hypothetical protein
VRKSCLWKGKRMNAATFVDTAGKLAGHLVAREMRGPGDVDNAMRRLETRYGVPYQALWSLRYRRPKEIAAHVYAGIIAAYDAQCDQQAKRLEHERSITRAKGSIAEAFVRAADAVVREED